MKFEVWPVIRTKLTQLLMSYRAGYEFVLLKKYGKRLAKDEKVKNVN
jgi:hypothetical protein